MHTSWYCDIYILCMGSDRYNTELDQILWRQIQPIVAVCYSNVMVRRVELFPLYVNMNKRDSLIRANVCNNLEYGVHCSQTKVPGIAITYGLIRASTCIGTLR